MRSSNQTGRTSKAPVKQSGPKTLTLIGMTIIVISLVLLSIFQVSSLAGSNKRNPVVVFYGVTGNFPKISMANTLHAAGFDYLITDDLAELDDDGEYIIASIGDRALDPISEYKSHENVLGFVMICPEIGEGQTLDGLGSNSLTQSVAIFSGKDNSSQLALMGTSRIIYERLSGDDTLYGIPIKRGGLFASKCFINNNQNRYLSLSAFKYSNDSSILFSPLFQNEFAGYLGVTYQANTIKDVSFSRINSWFVMTFVCIMAALFGEFLYLSLLAVVMTDTVKGSVPTEEKISMGFVGGLSIASVVGIIALSLGENLHKYIIIALMLLPLLFMFFMVVTRLKFIIMKQERHFVSKGNLRRPLFMAITSSVFLYLVSSCYGDLGIRYSIPEVALAAGCFLSATLLASLLVYADRKSRSLQMGGCSFFGNAICVPMMIVPSVFALIYGLIFKMSDIVSAGLGGLLTILVPYVFVIPVRRHSDNYLIPGLLYGFVFTIIFMLIA